MMHVEYYHIPRSNGKWQCPSRQNRPRLSSLTLAVQRDPSPRARGKQVRGRSRREVTRGQVSPACRCSFVPLAAAATARACDCQCVRACVCVFTAVGTRRPRPARGCRDRAAGCAPVPARACAMVRACVCVRVRAAHDLPRHAGADPVAVLVRRTCVPRGAAGGSSQPQKCEPISPCAWRCNSAARCNSARTCRAAHRARSSAPTHRAP